MSPKARSIECARLEVCWAIEEIRGKGHIPWKVTIKPVRKYTL